MELPKENRKSYAQVHSEMMQIYMHDYLQESRTTDEIRDEYLRLFGWKPCARAWRKFKDWFNDEYRADRCEWYIIGDRGGYRMTNDTAEIEEDCRRKRRIAIAMLWRVSNTRQQAALKDMYQLELNIEEENENE